MNKTGARVWVLRVIAFALAMAAAVPTSAVGARFFPLVRHSIQLSLLPVVPGASLMTDSCATILINELPRYCERIFTLATPDPSISSDYSNAIKGMGWEQESYYVGTGYDWDSRRTMKIECTVFRSFTWGVNEHMVLAVLDDQWFRLMGGTSSGFCNPSSKFR